MSDSRQLRATTMELGAMDLAVLEAGWFGGLPQALQARIVSRSRLRTFAKGDYLVRQGNVTKGMHGLLAGRTHHLHQVSEMQEVLLHVGAPGMWFGEYPLLSGEAAIGSVLAAAPTRTLFLPERGFEAIIEEEPRHLRHFARLLASRFGAAFRYLAESHGLAPEDWLLSRLRGLVETQHSGSIAGAPLDTISISQSQLASMVGLSRQTMNTLLARLARRGSIEVGFQSIRVRRGSGS